VNIKLPIFRIHLSAKGRHNRPPHCPMSARIMTPSNNVFEPARAVTPPSSAISQRCSREYPASDLRHNMSVTLATEPGLAHAYDPVCNFLRSKPILVKESVIAMVLIGSFADAPAAIESHRLSLGSSFSPPPSTLLSSFPTYLPTCAIIWQMNEHSSHGFG
jgi:hypothetical protein